MGFAGLISSMAILHLCEEYDATHEDFEKIIMIDEKMYEVRNQQNEEAKELKENVETLNKLAKKNAAKPRRKK